MVAGSCPRAGHPQPARLRAKLCRQLQWLRQPHPQLRTAVWVLAFVTSGLFVVSSISYAVLGQRERRRLAEELDSRGVVVLTEAAGAAAVQTDAESAQCSWQASAPVNEHAVQIGPNTTSHIIMSKYK
jgi:hypothetical protein